MTTPSLAWPQIVAAVIGGLALSQLLGEPLHFLAPELSPSLMMFHNFATQSSGCALLIGLVLIGVLSPIGEELLFRGYFQTRLAERWGAWPAIWISSGLFAAMHMDLLHSPLAMVIGLYLGYVTERAGSIRPAMACHVVNNIVAVLQARWVSNAEWFARTHALVAVASLAVLLGCLTLLRRPRGQPA